MNPSDVRCGVVIFADRENRFRSCGAKATSHLVFNGDRLFSVCSRHNARLERAIPDLRSSQPVGHLGPLQRLRLPA